METKKIKIGEYEVLANYSLLVPKGTTALIPVHTATVSFSLEVKFDNETPEMGVSFAVAGNVLTMVFRKWDNVLGTATKEVEPLITLSPDQKLFFMASNYLIGDTNNLMLQILQREREVHAGE